MPHQGMCDPDLWVSDFYQVTRGAVGHEAPKMYQAPRKQGAASTHVRAQTNTRWPVCQSAVRGQSTPAALHQA